MAVSSGVGPHSAWVTVNGGQFPLQTGSCSLEATKSSATFSGTLPLGYPGAEATFAGLGDNTASILVMTRGQQATLVTGEIDDIKFDYINGEISFSGRDATAKLHNTKTSEKWVNKQPDEIISDLASRVGLSPSIDPLAIKAGRIISTDWSKLTNGVSYGHAIHKLADFMGAHWYVNAGTLFVKTTDSSSSPYTINYQPGPPKVSDALSLHISRNIQAGKPITVTVKSWHSRKKQAFTGTHTIGGNGSTMNYGYDIPGLTQDHVDQHAKAKAKNHARHELSLSAELVGDPSISIAQSIQLNGTAFAQTFKIDSIRHSFGMAGHKMTIEAKTAAKGRSDG